MPTPTPPIQPLVPSYKIRILTDKKLEQFRSGSLQILEKTGFKCPSERALRIYAENGAQVDFETQIVKLSEKVIMKALSHVPRYYTMGGRTEKFDLDLSKPVTYEATDGTGTKTIDYKTRELRSSIKDDVAKSARIADYLSSISFYWPMVSAQDHPIAPSLHELEASFNNTLKHVQTPTIVEEITTRHAIEMARVVAGSDERLKKSPPLSLLICTIAPLAMDEGAMDAALVAAEAEIPVGFMAMPNTGSTAPATIAGTIVLGAPVYHSLMPGMTHPRTGAYYGLDSYVYAIGVELAHMWGVPTLAGSFGSGAHDLGWEFASGGGKASLLCALCGAETGSGMGLLRGSTLLVPEALVLDAELYHAVQADLAELNTSPDYMALDVIDAVGPRGHFLRERHTREYFRKLGFSEVQQVPTKDGEYRDVLEVAREKTDWILENHHPEPLSNEQQKELTKIVKAAEKELREKE